LEGVDAAPPSLLLAARAIALVAGQWIALVELLSFPFATVHGE